ncbi:DUF2929 domain-containing protein [Halalkalibacillus sediminis]|uniref:DUF2929 domain-containing protein n=1 Tax=Halalkalibacillus sediminis TaxID=2018042 RepID=A0A2I0QVH8_9BACI|nr:YjzD family protein [Halalkalibacillus sediminis]PKR78335.1 DUF2929 domain-containing protein [Halalkalibacillus sediminis]
MRLFWTAFWSFLLSFMIVYVISAMNEGTFSVVSGVVMASAFTVVAILLSEVIITDDAAE